MRELSPLSRTLDRRALEREFRANEPNDDTVWLDAIEATVDGAPLPRGVRLPRIEWLGPVRDDAASAARVEALYPRLVATAKPGSWHAEALLLELATRRPRPSTLAVFEAALAVSRPRDSKAAERRALAVAGLAVLALDGVQPHAAVAALADHAERCRPADLLDVVEALAAVVESDSPAAASARLALAAPASKRSLAARFLAGLVLSAEDAAAPMGSFAHVDLEVRLRSAPKVVRTLRLRADDTLAELHLAIQRAFDWDADHAYEFCLEPDGRDPRALIDGALPDGGVWDGDGLARASEIELRALDLRPGDALAYLFDFGDQHRFSIEVVALDAKGGKAPKGGLVRAVGKAPAQYER